MSPQLASLTVVSGKIVNVGELADMFVVSHNSVVAPTDISCLCISKGFGTEG